MKRCLLLVVLLLSLTYPHESAEASLKNLWEWASGSPDAASQTQARKYAEEFKISPEEIFSPPEKPSKAQVAANIFDKGVAIAIGVFAGQAFGEFITGGGGVVAGITTGAIVTISVLYDPILGKIKGLATSLKRNWKENKGEVASDLGALVIGAGMAAPWIPFGVAVLVETFVPGKCLSDVPYANASGTALAVGGALAIGEITRLWYKTIMNDDRREASWMLWRYESMQYGKETSLKEFQEAQQTYRLPPLSKTLRWRIPFVAWGTLSSLKAIDMFSRNAALALFFNCPEGTPTPATPKLWVPFQEKASDFTNGVWITGAVPVALLIAAGWQYGGLINHVTQAKALSSTLAFVTSHVVSLFSGVIIADTMKHTVLPHQSLLVSLDTATQGLGQLLAGVNAATLKTPAPYFNIFSGAVLGNAGAILGPLRVGIGLMLGAVDALLEAPLALATTLSVTILLNQGLERFFNGLPKLHSRTVGRIDGIERLRREVSDMSSENIIAISRKSLTAGASSARAERVSAVNSSRNGASSAQAPSIPEDMHPSSMTLNPLRITVNLSQ